jgi:glycosyltransferase involved in cell wall biosynthesis
MHSNAVTACSAYLLNMVTSVLHRDDFNGTVVYNGIDYSQYIQKKERIIKEDYFMAFGRLSYVKGFDMLIRAYSMLPEEIRKQFILVIAGSGPEKDSLEQLAITLKIQNRVKFYGRASQREIVSLLQHSSLTIVPSRMETFGIALLEAMAVNTRIVATRVGGMPEIARYGNVTLTEPQESSLYDGILQAFKINDHADSNQLTDADGLFTEESMLKRYEKVLAPD